MTGNSVQLMRALPRNAVDFILTDPPYLVNYQGKDGRKVPSDPRAYIIRLQAKARKAQQLSAGR